MENGKLGPGMRTKKYYERAKIFIFHYALREKKCAEKRRNVVNNVEIHSLHISARTNAATSVLFTVLKS